MDFEFRDPELGRLATDPAYQGRGDRAVVKAFRMRVQSIDAAIDERDLRRMKGHRFEKLKGSRSHQHSMRLNDQWRLILEIKDRDGSKIIEIVAIEDYH